MVGKQLSILVTVLLIGCMQSDRGQLTLTPVSFEPIQWVSMSEDDLSRWPPLGAVVADWRATGNGSSYIGDYRNLASIVEDLQARGGEWAQSGVVNAKLNASFFEIAVGRIYA